MSLLLDALKEAETRSRPEPSESARPETPPVVASRVAESGAKPVSVDQPLSLIEESSSVVPPAPAPATARRTHASVQRAPPAVAVAANASPQPVPARPWSRYALFVAVPIAGALYWTMFRGASAPVPALAPPMVNWSAPVTVPDAAMPAVDALGVDEVLPAAVFTPAEPEPLPTSADPVPTAPVAQNEPTVSVPRNEPTAVAADVERPQLIVERSSPLAEAHTALRAGDLRRAEALYRATLAADADQPDARLGLALIEQSRGANAAALQHYRAVLQHRPADPQVWAGMADIVGDGELDAMESKLRNLIAARSDPALYFALGNLLVRQSRWPEAQESYFAAASSAPLNADYAFNLAVALDRLGKGRAAMPHYARALALASDQRAVQFDIAAVRARLDLLEAAAP